MGDLLSNVSRRSVLATTGVLFAGIGASRVAKRATNSESSASSDSSTEGRLLVENPTNRPLRFSLSATDRPISAFVLTNRRGETKVVQRVDEGLQLASAVRTEATKIEPKNGVVFDREYTVEAHSALLFRLRGIPERGQLLYTLKPRSANRTTLVETWGTMSCSSQFDVYLTPNETRSSCGSRIAELDRHGGATERTINLRTASSDDG
ncbi:hypothetical protein [Haladaptatus salinisoli]|uniref:hypothetical protein n=1 Tax=Haladaptatus salinisoli TaxID=2884876 RepID=UPI001D09A53C|nr:hypothetical protein [Haladaptatus salinisoli]